MERRQLEVFVAVAEAGSVAQGADRLGVGQPAASQALRRLEDTLGLVLLERSSRGVTLTSDGAALLPPARDALWSLARVESVAHGLASGRQGTIRLAGTSGASDVLRALRQLHRQTHPGVQIELRRAAARKLHAILAGELDAALTRAAPRTPGITFVELRSEPWEAVLATSHPLAIGRSAALAELARYHLIVVARTSRERVRAELLRLCAAVGAAPAIVSTVANLDDALAEIADSEAWTLLGASAAARISDPACRTIPVSDDVEPARLWLAHRSNPTPAVRAVAAHAARMFN